MRSSLIPLLLPLLLLLLLSVRTQATTSCPPGQVRQSATCKPCPPGTYRQAGASNTCRPCPSGHYQPARGAIHKDLCRVCPQRTFAAAPSSVACKPCPPGKSAGYAASTCMACPAGHSLSYFGATCYRCRAGTYANGRNPTECSECPRGYTSPDASATRASCTPCRPGDRYPCFACRASEVQVGDTCAECPPGTMSTGGFARRCSPCPIGMFRPPGSLSKCQNCPKGLSAKGPGAMHCRRNRKPCPKGMFINSAGDCERCAMGFRYDARVRRCLHCPAGAVGRGGLSPVCHACSGGMRPDASRGKCVCGVGELYNARLGKCGKCPLGTYRIDFFHVFPRCIPCHVGHVASRVGSSACKRCPDGLVANKAQSYCKACASPMLPNTLTKLQLLGRNGHSVCVMPASGCAVAYERVIQSRYSFCRPVRCSLSSVPADLDTKCVGCGKGAVVRADGHPGCTICPMDSVSEGGLASKCNKCAMGMRRDSNSPSKCSCVGLNALGRGLNAAGGCRKCAAGWMSAAEDSMCKACPAGEFNSKAGSWYCEPCSGNSIAASAGSSSCAPCGKGLRANRSVGGTACVADR